jgi:nitrite reductase (NADH) large subunit
MSRQLPREGGEYLASVLSQKGIRFITGADTDKVHEDYPGSCVIIAAGVRPDTAALKDSGIAINRAVTVDAAMQTNIQGIYACGDIAEFNGKNPGLFPVAIQQGKTAGANVAGAAEIYTEIPPSPLLKIGEVSVFSAGDNQDGTILFDTADGAFKSVALKDGILTGGTLIGDIALSNKLKNAVAQKRDFAGAQSLKDILNAL